MEKQKKLMEKIAKSVPEQEENFFCVLANQNGTGITALKGDPWIIAKTLFYQINHEQLLSEKLYLLIKNIVINLVKNQTELGEDLIKAVLSQISLTNEEQI